MKLGRQHIPLVNPCWLPLVTFSSFMCLKVASQSICSPVFQRTEVMMASYKYPGSFLPFFEVGATPAFFQALGIFPLGQNLSKGIEVSSSVTSASSFSSLGCPLMWCDGPVHLTWVLFFLWVLADCNRRLRNSRSLRRSLTCEVWAAYYICFPVACHWDPQPTEQWIHTVFAISSTNVHTKPSDSYLPW